MTMHVYLLGGAEQRSYQNVVVNSSCYQSCGQYESIITAVPCSIHYTVKHNNTFLLISQSLCIDVTGLHFIKIILTVLIELLVN